MNDERFFDRLYDLHASSEVRGHYDRFAESYDDELLSRGYAQPDRAAAAVAAAGISHDAAILDAGCGTGLSGMALASRGYRNIHGCDYSPEMLVRAAKTGAYRSLDEIDLNADPLHVPGGPFDVVTAVGVLGHGHVAGSAISRLVELLRPGGLLVIAINGKAWPEGDALPAIEHLEHAGVIGPHVAELGDHIPGLDSQGWLVTTTRH